MRIWLMACLLAGAMALATGEARAGCAEDCATQCMQAPEPKRTGGDFVGKCVKQCISRCTIKKYGKIDRDDGHDPHKKYRRYKDAVIIHNGIVIQNGQIVQPGAYGAIALSPSTLNYAIVNDAASMQDAQDRAMATCKASTPGQPMDCVIGAWFQNACGSFAREHNAGALNKAWAAQWAYTPEAAEAQALQACNRDSAMKTCDIMATLCNR